MADARKESWVEVDPSDVLIEYENEEVEEDATYSERISSDVPAGNSSGARGSSKEMTKKARKFLWKMMISQMKKMSLVLILKAWMKLVEIWLLLHLKKSPNIF